MKKIFFCLLIMIVGALPSVNARILTELNIDRDSWCFDSLVFDNRVHIDNIPSEEGMTIDLVFTYPTCAPTEIDIERLGRVFISTFSKDAPTSVSITNAFDSIKSGYIATALEYGKEWEKEKGEFPGFPDFSNYIEQKSNSIDLISKYVITTSTSQYSYLGGAHGSHYVGYYNIDLRDYQIIKEEELFKSGYEEPLAALIQAVVEERNNSPYEDEHIMLLVEIPEIKPNDNFYFSTEGLVYVYNQYEISPYVQGVVEITIPYDKIKPLLNNRFLEVVDNIE